MKESFTKGSLIVALLTGVLSYAGADDRPRFSDPQIVAMTPHYFKRMQSENAGGDPPQFLGANIYRHPQRGRVFQVDIRVDRNQENAGLALAFTAMLNLSRYFKKSPDLFVAIIHSSSRGSLPVICTGDAECTADHYLRRRISYKEWYQKCITFERSWSFGIAPEKALP